MFADYDCSRLNVITSESDESSQSEAKYLKKPSSNFW